MPGPCNWLCGKPVSRRRRSPAVSRHFRPGWSGAPTRLQPLVNVLTSRLNRLRNRNHPRTIKRRFAAVVGASALSCACVYSLAREEVRRACSSLFAVFFCAQPPQILLRGEQRESGMPWLFLFGFLRNADAKSTLALSSYILVCAHQANGRPLLTLLGCDPTGALSMAVGPLLLNLVCAIAADCSSFEC